MGKIRILTLIVLVATANLFSQNAYIRSFFDKKEYIIGDRIIFRIELKSSEEIDNVLPEFPDTSKIFETLDVKKSSMKEKDSYVYRVDYVLTKFDSGRIFIPSFKVKYFVKGESIAKIIEAEGDEALVNYAQISTEEELRDIKSPIRIPLDWKSILLYVLIFLVIGGAIYYYVRKFYLKKYEYKTVIKRIIPPGEKALNSLKELEEKKLWQRGLVKEYHSEITEIIRLYFEERFGFPALKLTTGEALDFLREQNLEVEMIEAAEKFLNAADLVKFAKFNPDPELNEQIMKFAREFVEKTKMDIVQETKEIVKMENLTNGEKK